MQDIPLASVLKSPFGGVSDEEMAWIVAEHKAGVDRSRDAGLYRAVVEYMNEDGPVKSNDESDESSIADAFRFQKNKLIQKNNLRRKLQKLFTLLDTFRQESVYLPMHDSSTGFTDKTAITAMCRRFRAGRDGAAIWICWWRKRQPMRRRATGVCSISSGILRS